MHSSRSALRCSAALRVARSQRTLVQRRFDSTTTQAGNSTASGQSHATTALYGGLAGGVFAALIGYGFYSFSGIKTAVNTAHQVKSYYDTGKQKLAQAAPEPNEVLDWLRKQTHFYAAFVPGGRAYVDSAFNDIDTVREKHGDEVDKIVREAYDELKSVTSNGLSVSTASDAWEVLQKHLVRIGDLASDSAKEIMDNHPQLKSMIGSNVDQLRSLGDSVGPEANKVVTETWSQVRDIVTAGGLSTATIAKLKQLINEKTEQVKQMGDKAWTKGVEELQPYLDKNPQMKELLNSNKKELLSGNIMELWSKAKEAAQSGSTGDLEQYIKQSVEKVKQKSGNASSMAGQYIEQMIPGGTGQLASQYNQIKSMVENADTKELEKLAKDTVGEIQAVLEKKLAEGKNLLGDASKGAK